VEKGLKNWQNISTERTSPREEYGVCVVVGKESTKAETV
jgi:hypothetical protein